jgi:MYXO-CTERM domain-containing protein
MPLKRVTAVLVASAALVAAPAAFATPAQIHTVFWKQDTSTQSSVDQLFGCLAKSSTFGSTWSQEFGIDSVTYTGSTVLQDAAPSQAILGGNLGDILNNAFANNTLPPPAANVFSEYVFYLPNGVAGGDTMGGQICAGMGMCAEHYPFGQYNGVTFDYAIVPISCMECGGFNADTIGGEHEAAEGLADLAGCQFEVGDGCEDPNMVMKLSCCGQSYEIQPLAGSDSPNDCQPIQATGNMCGCGPSQSTCTADSDCCSGLSCKTSERADGGAGLACCSASGATCTVAADCCGALVCTAGKCSCAPAQSACLSDADCCAGLTCSQGHQCVGPPSMPEAGVSEAGGTSFDAGERDAGSGLGENDASSGGSNDNGDSGTFGDAPGQRAGCACQAGGEGGSSRLIAIAVGGVLLGMSLRRRRRRGSSGAR